MFREEVALMSQIFPEHKYSFRGDLGSGIHLILAHARTTPFPCEAASHTGHVTRSDCHSHLELINETRLPLRACDCLARFCRRPFVRADDGVVALDCSNLCRTA